MAIYDCGKDVRAYHDKRATLSKGDQQEMHDRRESGRTRLRSNLDKQGRPQPTEIASQGSYAMRTMVQDDDCEYDIDDGVYFLERDLRDDTGAAFGPRSSRQFVCDALKSDQRLKHDAEVKDNCVRQEYPEGYHIDMPVYRSIDVVDDKGVVVGTKFELASGDRWTESDARAVTKWFADKVGTLNRDELDGSQLRRVVKLAKKFARRQNDWKKATTSGICITVLVESNFVPVEGRDDASLLRTLKAIDALASGAAIKHPVLKGNLAEAYDVKVTFFRSCVRTALKDLGVVERDDCEDAEARAAWDRVFNTTFFSDQPSNGNGGTNGGGGGKRSVSIAGGAQVSRDDGGRRFGS